MSYFCITPKHPEEVFALPRMLMIKTLLTIWDNTSALVPALLFRPERIFVEAWRVLF